MCHLIDQSENRVGLQFVGAGEVVGGVRLLEGDESVIEIPEISLCLDIRLNEELFHLRGKGSLPQPIYVITHLQNGILIDASASDRLLNGFRCPTLKTFTQLLERSACSRAAGHFISGLLKTAIS